MARPRQASEEWRVTDGEIHDMRERSSIPAANVERAAAMLEVQS
jgi:hypothetical protein